MEITGTVVNILPEQTGEGRNGPWRKQEFILETEGMYPRKVCVAVWGDKIDQFSVKEGEKVTASVNIESREFNGRWYTDVKAWKMDKAMQQGPEQGSVPQAPFVDTDIPTPPEVPPLPDEEDDLPF
jgi:hypothetical protein